MKPQTSPRAYRLSPNALNALKILKASFTEDSDAQIVSKALIQMASKTENCVVKFKVLDPRELLTLQAEVSMLELKHKAIKRDIMRIRPGHKSSADKIAQIVEKADAERERLKSLRHSLTRQGRLAETLTPENALLLKGMRKWIQCRFEKAEEKWKPWWQLELAIINQLYPCSNSSDAQASKPPVAPASPSGSNTFPTQTTKST